MHIPFSTLFKDIFERAIKTTGGDWGIVFKDLTRLEEFSINPDLVFSSASLIKLPILVSVLFAANDELINLDSRLNVDNSKISSEHKSGSGIVIHLTNPVSLTIKDLCYLMITVSDNYATDYLVSIIGVDYINSILKKLGLNVTSLNHNLVAFNELIGKNPITPKETTKLLELIYSRKIPFSDLAEDILQCQIYSTRLPLLIPFEEIEDGIVSIAHKTGTIKTVAHDAGIIRTPRRNYILCVLTQNQKNISETNLAIANLSKQIYDYCR